MYRICAIAIVLASVNAWPQQTTDKSDHPICGYSERYREAGWRVPGLDGAKKKTARTAVPTKAGVYLTILEPANHELSVQVFRCFRTHIGRLEVAEITVGSHPAQSLQMRTAPL